TPCTTGLVPVTRNCDVGGSPSSLPATAGRDAPGTPRARHRRDARSAATAAGDLGAGGRPPHPPDRHGPRPARPHHDRRVDRRAPDPLARARPRRPRRAPALADHAPPPP